MTSILKGTGLVRSHILISLKSGELMTCLQKSEPGPGGQGGPEDLEISSGRVRAGDGGSVFFIHFCVRNLRVVFRTRLASSACAIQLRSGGYHTDLLCSATHSDRSDQWKTRNVARYLTQIQASRLLSSGSVQEGDREAHRRRCSEAGATADVRVECLATKLCRGTVN